MLKIIHKPPYGQVSEAHHGFEAARVAMPLSSKASTLTWSDVLFCGSEQEALRGADFLLTQPRRHFWPAHVLRYIIWCPYLVHATSSSISSIAWPSCWQRRFHGRMRSFC